MGGGEESQNMDLGTIQGLTVITEEKLTDYNLMDVIGSKPELEDEE